MTETWQGLQDPARETARSVFAALDGARALTDATAPPRPSLSAIWSALVSGRPLPPGIVMDGDLDALLADAAVIAMPRQAAAATEPDGVDRRAEGAQVRITPSRGGPGQSYLTVTFEDPTVGATRLIAVTDGAAPLEIPLPPSVAGAAQVLLDNADPILVALADPDSRLYLV